MEVRGAMTTARRRIVRIALTTLLAFGALNAFGGAWYGLSGAPGIPREWLHGSPFADYFVPSLVLGVVVGGSFSLATIALLRAWPRARPLCIAAGAVVLGWIVVQLRVIGFVSWLQPVTALWGAMILALAILLPSDGPALGDARGAQTRISPLRGGIEGAPSARA
jgi:hypothetical protein